MYYVEGSNPAMIEQELFDQAAELRKSRRRDAAKGQARPFAKKLYCQCCGSLLRSKKINGIVLGQYRGKQLIYKGHVTLGVSGESFRKIRELPKLKQPEMEVPEDNEQTVWVQPQLVCTVKYMMKTEGGSLRQPVFKGLREDKQPSECIED